MNRIKTISIANFRHLNNLSNIKIGEKLTVIAGVNGTGKSSLLGLIGHIFSFRDESGIIKSIDNKPFETKFSEVFRFSPDYDYRVPYTYSLTFEDGTIKNAVSRYIERDRRFRIDVGARQRTSGKERLPVIYLGLKRLIPLAQENEKSIKTIEDDKLSEEDKNLYKDWHNRVLVINDQVMPQHTKSRNKELYYAECEKYDANGNSAGQDNIAQIILALLSFKKLKEEMQTDYLGGLLLIDEVDATLYPAAQFQLMKLLLKAATDYELQIIFTSHSIEIIRCMLDPDERDLYFSSEVVYLRYPSGIIEVIQDKNEVKGIIAELRHERFTELAKPKTSIYLEDAEARLFFKGIIDREIKKELKIQNFNFGANAYGSLIEGKFPDINKSLFVIDGDKSNNVRLKRLRNVLFLPGSTRPENVIYDYLYRLPENNNFWDFQLGGYNKGVFLNNLPININDSEKMKAWFNEQRHNWGVGCKKLLKYWKKDNIAEVEQFNTKLKNKLVT
jgi:energy-coupling factor transporter ATP-binding protein EcfA2